MVLALTSGALSAQHIVRVIGSTTMNQVVSEDAEILLKDKND